jgi:hypothetical protein
MEMDDEIDLLAGHLLARRADDVAEPVELDHPHADEFGGGAQPLHAFVLGAGLFGPHPDDADRVMDAGQSPDPLLRFGDRIARNGGGLPGRGFDGVDHVFGSLRGHPPQIRDVTQH